MRAAWHEGALYYQLRPDRVVKVDAGGWGFEPRPKVLFRRLVNLRPLPDPESGGNIETLLGYANVRTERDRRLLLAYVTTITLPQIPRPIFSASGAMGSGKTTIGRLVKRLLDPTAPETVRIDKDILQKATHAYIVMLDNQGMLSD